MANRGSISAKRYRSLAMMGTAPTVPEIDGTNMNSAFVLGATAYATNGANISSFDGSLWTGLGNGPQPSVSGYETTAACALTATQGFFIQGYNDSGFNVGASNAAKSVDYTYISWHGQALNGSGPKSFGLPTAHSGDLTYNLAGNGTGVYAKNRRVFSINGIVYGAFGYQGSSGPISPARYTDTLYSFSASTNDWTYKQTLGSSSVKNGVVAVVGATAYFFNSSYGTKYNPTTNTFSSAASFTSSMAGGPIWSGSTNIYCVERNKIWQYTVASNSWSQIRSYISMSASAFSFGFVLGTWSYVNGSYLGGPYGIDTIYVTYKIDVN